MQKIILVVEDEPSILEAIEINLGKAGFRVIGTGNIDNAWIILSKEPKIDLIWLDHYLHGKNGLEFVTRLKSDERYKKIPVFLVSNSADVKDVYSYMNLGIEKYYVKMDSAISGIVADVKKYLDSPEESKLT